MLTLDLQLYAVLVMFLTGVALGLVFDVYRGVRSTLNPGPIATGIGDVLFWVAGTTILIAALLFGTWGEVRLFVPVGIALGLVTYRALAGRLIARGTRRILRLIARVVQAVAGWIRAVAMVAFGALTFLVRILLWPVIAIAGWFNRPWHWVRRQVRRLLSPIVRLRRRIEEALQAFRDGPPPPPQV